MADDFFKEDKMEPQIIDETTTPEVIKLGEKEYSQEELSKLVGLGEQAVELEEKWDTKLDRLMPEYSKSRNELKTLKEQAETAAQQTIDKKEEKGEEVSEEERAAIVKAEAKKYGLMTNEDFESQYANRRAGEKLHENVLNVISKAVGEGKPKTTDEELLVYMSETGVKDPQTAYEVMFKNQLREIEMKALSELKPSGLYTESSSTAGSKEPQPVAVTKDNLGDLLGEVLSRNGAQ